MNETNIAPAEDVIISDLLSIVADHMVRKVKPGCGFTIDGYLRNINGEMYHLVTCFEPVKPRE